MVKDTVEVSVRINMKRSRWSFDADEGKDSKNNKSERQKDVGGETKKTAEVGSDICNGGSQVVALEHPLVTGCRSVEAFDKISHIDEGTYGIVWKAKERKTGKVRNGGLDCVGVA